MFLKLIAGFDSLSAACSSHGPQPAAPSGLGSGLCCWRPVRGESAPCSHSSASARITPALPVQRLPTYRTAGRTPRPRQDHPRHPRAQKAPHSTKVRINTETERRIDSAQRLCWIILDHRRPPIGLALLAKKPINHICFVCFWSMMTKTF